MWKLTWSKVDRAEQWILLASYINSTFFHTYFLFISNLAAKVSSLGWGLCQELSKFHMCKSVWFEKYIS